MKFAAVVFLLTVPPLAAAGAIFVLWPMESLVAVATITLAVAAVVALELRKAKK